MDSVLCHLWKFIASSKINPENWKLHQTSLLSLKNPIKDIDWLVQERRNSSALAMEFQSFSNHNYCEIMILFYRNEQDQWNLDLYLPHEKCSNWPIPTLYSKKRSTLRVHIDCSYVVVCMGGSYASGVISAFVGVS